MRVTGMAVGFTTILRAGALVPLAALLSAAALPAATLNYKDKLGRTIRLEVPVRRAVVYELYEFLPALKCWDRIAGLSRHAHTSALMLAAKPDIASTIPAVGSGADVNTEALLRLKPDVVLTWTHRPDVVQFLEQKGVKVIAVYPDSVREMYEVIELQGKLFGREREAAGVVREMERVFELVRRRSTKIPPAEKARLMLTFTRQNTVGAASSLSENLIQMIGAVNAAASMQQRSADVPIETILGWNPDVVFIWGSAQYTAASTLNSPQWRSVKAVRDKRVFKAPQWSTWSPCLALVGLWMGAKTYPGLYQDIDVHAEADRFFRNVFGLPVLEAGRNDF